MAFWTRESGLLSIQMINKRRSSYHPLVNLGLLILMPLIFFIIVGPYLTGYEYDAIQLPLQNQPPSSQFIFGTDDLGRDILTRICYGGRISLSVGLLAAFIDLAIGIIWGGIAGFCGGKIDEIMMRLADILYALPYLLVVILLTAVLGSGIYSLLVALTLTGWITMARIVRGQILSLKQMDFISAARLLGIKPFRLLFCHLLPNIQGSIFVVLTLTISSAIFAEAFLSFLGLGIQAPIASWGSMANEGLPALPYFPWRLFFPAAMISLTMLALHLIGEGLKLIFGHTNQRETI
jgi:oligopeptide transport system permease protein